MLLSGGCGALLLGLVLGGAAALGLGGPRTYLQPLAGLALALGAGLWLAGIAWGWAWRGALRSEFRKTHGLQTSETKEGGQAKRLSSAE